MKRLLVAVVSVLLLLAASSSLLSAPASSAPVTLTTSCQGTIFGISQAQAATLALDVTTPATVAQGTDFQVTYTPGPSDIPTSASGQTVNAIANYVMRFPVPAGTTYVSSTLSGGSGLGAGVPTVANVGGRITLSAPGPFPGGTTVQLPTITATLHATGSVGSIIAPSFAGTSFGDPGFTFTVKLGIGDVSTVCFANPNPALGSTTITSPAPAVVPGAPTIGVATAGNTSVGLTWTAPASNGGSPITGYVVTPYIAGVAQPAQTFASPALSQTIGGLGIGTAYTFTVAATNAVGTGAPSAQSNEATPVGFIPPTYTTFETWTPTVGCGTVQGVTAPANTESVTVTVIGGKGGRSGSQASSATVAGGSGGRAVGTFAATPGQQFSAVVGCDGVDGGSFGNSNTRGGYSKGGGSGRGSIIAGQPGASGGTGGGSSAACSGAVCLSTEVATPLAVAGGGGGGGVSNCAGTGSGPGGSGGTASSTSAGGGSGPSGANGTSAKSAGGAGGVNSSGGSPSGGTSANGSGGLSVNVVGGGGGGGYVGGGAGAGASTGCSGAGGGGGGSSWLAGGATAPAFGATSSAPSVTLRFKMVRTPLVLKPNVGSVIEGNVGPRTLNVPITLSAPSATPVTVDFQTFDTPASGVATSGVDFEATSGTLTFAPGETTKTVAITVLGDTIKEPPLLYGEWVLVAFSNPSTEAVLDTSFFGIGVGIIADDD